VPLAAFGIKMVARARPPRAVFPPTAPPYIRRMSSLDELMVKPGEDARLAERDTASRLHFKDKDNAKAGIAEDAREIDRLQDVLYAESKRALLVILQGTDTSGKDGTIRDVFNATGPLGVRVVAFRPPSEEERAHDFLWRVHRACPPRGTIGIFNRSHYEDVLVARVRNLAPAAEIEARYDQINAFENILAENGTRILKFMLHISNDEQRDRLQARLDDPKKRWKFHESDLEDRQHWEDFQAAYEIALSRCSTEWAPWYVIPADRKWVRSAAIAGIVQKTLKNMDPCYPKPAWDPGEYTIL
jgi:PPK2 family polyphosphate:nucleotide phosphotransferase